MHTIFKHEEALPQMREIQTDFCFGHDCASYFYQLDLEARRLSVKLRLIYGLIRSLWAFTSWNSKDTTNIEYGFTADFFFVFTA